MPRSAFISDVRDLAARAGKAELAAVENVRFDDDTDEVHVTFGCADENAAASVNVCVFCADLDFYPDSRHYFMKATDDAPSPSHTWAVDEVQREIQDADRRCTLLQVVRKLIHKFEPLLANTESIYIDSDSSDDSDGEGGAVLDVEVEDGLDSFSTSVLGTKRRRFETSREANPVSSELQPGRSIRLPHRRMPHAGGTQFEVETGARRARIAEDLKAVCDAGYFFGVIDGMTGSDDNNIVAVSVKIATLGLSFQMLLAWDLDPEMYFVLLIRFSAGYIAHEPLLHLTNIEAGLSFRVGKCTHYKPSALHAHSAFGTDSLLGQSAADVLALDNSAAFSKILISGELGKLMSDSFLTLLRIHEAYGLSWSDTLYAMATQQQQRHELHANANTNAAADAASASKATSLPLLAMEFAVDRIRNYTKYCQSCFTRLDKSWQSFKPSVCSRELCLYQHIQIGLTQYLEYEILCQPAVIDLLINFCYVALAASINTPEASSAMRKFPSGMRLFVPDENNKHGCILHKLNSERFVIAFPAKETASQFKQGHWMGVSYAMKPAKTTRVPPVTPAAPSAVLSPLVHAVITEVDMDNMMLYMKASSSIEGMTEQGFVFPYTRNIDDVPDKDKANLLLGIFDTMPSVDELRTQLQSPFVSSLKAVDSLSPSAAVLLEWIIATNRSCIMQITSPQLMALEFQNRNRFAPPQGWLQFCFLHGSPDHEAQFEAELARCQTYRMLSSDLYPTIFAWHGSDIKNWHSILRTGLDYQVQQNGRAYGHGVYFSHSFAQSLTYAKSTAARQWPRAVTDLASVLSLNEIINAPHHFTSQSPHYVVHQKNWSRCRFLFAQAHSKVPDSWPRTQNTAAPPTANQGYISQDPTRQVLGPQGSPLWIPLASMPPRAPATVVDASTSSNVAETAQTLQKSRKDDVTKTLSAQDLAFIQNVQPQREVFVIDDDTDAIEIVKVVQKAPIEISDDEDAVVAIEPPSKKVRYTADPQPAQPSQPSQPPPPPPEPINQDVTSFVPGTLDHASLRVLQPPSWGTQTALRVLASGMRDLQKMQATTPPPNLGWHIDFDRLENLFQWVVELHSFDNKIPLAADMRRGNVNSIVMEMRFGPDYPFSPPLVRVIRPRFLPLMQGGGGHVTAGGSMCMELLTSTGWRPSYDLAAVLLQVHLALTTAEPPARLDMHQLRSRADYGIEEALQGYMRSAATHGWSVPKDMAMRGRF